MELITTYNVPLEMLHASAEREFKCWNCNKRNCKCSNLIKVENNVNYIIEQLGKSQKNKNQSGEEIEENDVNEGTICLCFSLSLFFILLYRTVTNYWRSPN